MLEIQAAEKEETEIIMDLLPAISSALQTLQGIDCDKQLQSINVVTMSLNLLKFGPITIPGIFLIFARPTTVLTQSPRHLL